MGLLGGALCRVVPRKRITIATIRIRDSSSNNQNQRQQQQCSHCLQYKEKVATAVGTALYSGCTRAFEFTCRSVLCRSLQVVPAVSHTVLGLQQLLYNRADGGCQVSDQPSDIEYMVVRHMVLGLQQLLYNLRVLELQYERTTKHLSQIGGSKKNINRKLRRYTYSSCSGVNQAITSNNLVFFGILRYR